MTTIEEGLVNKLINNTALKALIGDRVYALTLAQNTVLPAIVYQRISTWRAMTLDQGAGGLSNPRFQFTIYAASYASAKAVADALRNALLGYRGWVGKTSNVQIHGILSEGEFDSYEPEADVYYTTVDYKVSHKE